MNKLALVSMALTLVGAGCVQTQTKTETPQPPASASPTQATEAAFKNMIEVNDQKSGDKVTIDRVFLEQKGYVVVHEDGNGSVGEIVGHSNLLSTGETRSITLNMKIHADLSHTAMLHIDNGDGLFNEKQDLPLKDENGAYLMKSFKGEDGVMKEASEKEGM